MKKILFVAALAVCMISCKPTGAVCWLITVTGTVTTQYYFYGTEEEAEAQGRKYIVQSGDKYEISTTLFSKDNCK